MVFECITDWIDSDFDIEEIETLNEYNEAVIELNKKVNAYNERKQKLKRLIESDIW